MGQIGSSARHQRNIILLELANEAYLRLKMDFEAIFDGFLGKTDKRTDVARLGSPKIDHDVGVSTVSQYPVKKIDADYFDEGI